LTGARPIFCQPSTRRTVICPEAIKVQNTMVAVSVVVSAQWVFIRRSNSLLGPLAARKLIEDLLFD
jgi:hypothetical protein